MSENEQDAIPSVEERLYDQAASLGFVEPIELRKIRDKCTPGLLIEESRQLTDEYRRLTDQYVEEEIDSQDYQRQMGVMVALAGLFYRNGMIEESKQELNDALIYARSIGDMTTAKKLRALQFNIYDIRYRPR